MLWWPGFAFQAALPYCAALFALFVFYAARHIAKSVFAVGAALFTPLFVLFLYTFVSPPSVRALACFAAGALGAGLLLAAFSVKDTTAYRLWLALMAGGISFCAAALFGRVWPETAGAYNGWAAQFYLCAAVGFLLLFAAALMQPEKRRAAVPMALSVLGAAAGFVRLCSFARGGPLPSEGRGGDALEIIAVFGWCIVCGLLLSARLREKTGAAEGKAQNGSGGR